MRHENRTRFWKSSAGLGIVLLMAVAGGCGRNTGDLPAGFVPTGVTDQETFMIAELIVTAEAVPDTVVKITINDRTRADGYQLYRKTGGSDAFEKANIYVAPFRRTFNETYQIFEAIDREWQTGVQVEYIARATILGEESGSSPLTLNSAFIPAGTYSQLAAADTLRRVFPLDESSVDPVMVATSWPDTNDPSGLTKFRDCLCGVQWAPVENAYLYRVIIERTDGVLFLDYLTEQPGLFDQPLLLEQILFPLTISSFFWWVEAIDVDARVIARTPDLALFGVSPSFLSCDSQDQEDRAIFEQCYLLCTGEPSPLPPCPGP